MSLPQFERPQKDYIGDSVYAGFDGYSVWIWTDNGGGPENIICLEPEVFRSLQRFYDRQLAIEPHNP